MRPRLLDLFCGAGGAAMGYHRAGFEVVGVDRKHQPRYPFKFWQADALAFPARPYLPDIRVSDFVAIHASPPCQRYTTMGQRYAVTHAAHPDLIAETRRLLRETGLPYVIENVCGARSELLDPVMVCGRAVGLTLHRHRLFECSFPAMSAGCSRPDARDAAVYGKLDGRRLWTRVDGSELRAVKTLAEGEAAMGIDWMQWAELKEAIPPACTELIGHQLMQHVRAKVAA